MSSKDSFGAHDTLDVGDNSYEIYRLDAVPGTDKLPYSLKVLAENLLLAALGAILGLFLAYLGKDLLLGLLFSGASAGPCRSGQS